MGIKDMKLNLRKFSFPATFTWLQESYGFEN
jgi:hypothetical protein